ncbi:MAG: hypothetical protein WCV67_06565 [Victivallaceae bacterium]|jgi:hypothetical protein
MEKYSRKTLAAKRLQSFEFGFALFEAFDTPVSAASQNTNQFSKSSQSIVKFSAVRSITVMKIKFSEMQLYPQIAKISKGETILRSGVRNVQNGKARGRGS